MAGKTYNLRACQLIIGGVPITGFGADDAITFEAQEDASETAIGLDGEHVNRVINNDHMTATITLLPSSAANAALLAQYKAIKAALNEGIEANVGSFFFKDPLNGDIISDDVFYFQRPPDVTKGSEVSPFVWTLSLPNARGSYILAANRA